VVFYAWFAAEEGYYAGEYAADEDTAYAAASIKTSGEVCGAEGPGGGIYACCCPGACQFSEQNEDEEKGEYQYPKNAFVVYTLCSSGTGTISGFAHLVS
jgi:hypothetical protein